MGKSGHAAAVKRTDRLDEDEGKERVSRHSNKDKGEKQRASAQLLMENVPIATSTSRPAPSVGWGETGAADEEAGAAGVVNAEDNVDESRKTLEHQMEDLDHRISDLDHQADADKSDRDEQEQKLNKCIGIVIVVNTLMMGLELDYGPADGAPASDRVPWLVIESFIVLIFMTEIGIRVYWERQDWIRSTWNWCDLGICVAAVVETWILPFVNSGNQGLQMLTLLRIFRLVRLIRVVRLVRMFRALYISVMAFKAALSSIFYICIIMVMGLFICAIFTTSTIGRNEELKVLEMGVGITGWDRFGSVARSMYSLFELMTLEGWEQVGRPLVMKEPYMAIFLFAFIMIFTFGILNMIVAMVVEKTLMQARHVEESSQKELMHQVAEELKNMKLVFLQMDDDQSGQITKDELVSALQDNEKVQECFKTLGVPVRDAETLFSILDADCSDSLTVEELLEGLARIRGATDPDWDQLAMYATVRNLSRQVQQLHNEVRDVINQAPTASSTPTPAGNAVERSEALRAAASTPNASTSNGGSSAGGAASGGETLPGEVPDGDRKLPKAQQEAEFQAEVLRRLDAIASAQAATQRDVLRRLEAIEEQLSKSG